MSLGQRMSCARVRRALQERYDALPPRPPERRGDGKPEGRESGPLLFLPGFVAEHLSSCRKCAAFARSLEGMGVALREALDSRLASLPPPRIEEALLLASVRRETVRRRVARRESKERRAGRPHAWSSRLRWVALPVAAALVAVVAIPLLARQIQTRRLLRQEITAFVDELYAEPLLAGVEAAPYEVPDALELLGQAGAEIERWLSDAELPGAARY